MLGVLSGVTVPDLMRQTMPQLRFVLRHRGRILWPRLRPTVEAAFQPSEEGVQDIIKNHRARLSGQEPTLTQQDRNRELAWQIVASRYTGELPDLGTTAPSARPIPGVSTEAAAAVLAWAGRGACPDDVYVRDVAPYLGALRLTAHQAAACTDHSPSSHHPSGTVGSSPVEPYA